MIKMIANCKPLCLPRTHGAYLFSLAILFLWANPNRLEAQEILDQIVKQIIMNERTFTEGKLSGKIYSLRLSDSLVDESNHVTRFSFSPDLCRQRTIFYEPLDAMVVTTDSWIAGDDNEWTATVEGLHRFEDEWDDLGFGLDSRIADLPFHYSLRPHQKVEDNLFHVCSRFPPLSGKFAGWPDTTLSAVILACDVTKVDDFQIKELAGKQVELSSDQGTFSLFVIPALQYRIAKLVLSLDRKQVWMGHKLEDAGFNSLQFTWELSEFDDHFENFVLTTREDHQTLEGTPQNRVSITRICELLFHIDDEWIRGYQPIPEKARISVIGQNQLEHYYHKGRAFPQWDEARVENLSQLDLDALLLQSRFSDLLTWRVVCSIAMGVFGFILAVGIIRWLRNGKS
jgi:hypothetical protein